MKTRSTDACLASSEVRSFAIAPSRAMLGNFVSPINTCSDAGHEFIDKSQGAIKRDCAAEVSFDCSLRILVVSLDYIDPEP